MTISRAQLAKELEPGLNALFGMEYDRYETSTPKFSPPSLQIVHLKKR